MEQSNKQKPKGAWSHRFGIRFFTICLIILIFWLLGFFVYDIRTIKGPEYNEIEKELISKELINQKEELDIKISEINRKIGSQKNKQETVGKSSHNLQATINQLLELQKISLQKNMTFSEAEQKSFSESLNLFLSNQKQFQELNEKIVLLNEELNVVQDNRIVIENKIEEQKKPAIEKYDRLQSKHENKLAFFQLSILIPILLIAGILVLIYRNSIYFPIFISFGIASLLKVSLVIHEYFPSKFFKYILIAVSIAAIIKILIYFIQTIAFPKSQSLLKQFREGYEFFLCPICEYPIRRGPMKFLFWDRKSIKKISIPTNQTHDDTAYICPSCSTTLFEKCSSCSKTRNSLLPYCESCGEEKKIG